MRIKCGLLVGGDKRFRSHNMASISKGNIFKKIIQTPKNLRTVSRFSCLLLDFTKSFDSIDHGILYHMLKRTWYDNIFFNLTEPYREEVDYYKAITLVSFSLSHCCKIYKNIQLATCSGYYEYG